MVIERSLPTEEKKVGGMQFARSYPKPWSCIIALGAYNFRRPPAAAGACEKKGSQGMCVTTSWKVHLIAVEAVDVFLSAGRIGVLGRLYAIRLNGCRDFFHEWKYWERRMELETVTHFLLEALMSYHNQQFILFVYKKKKNYRCFSIALNLLYRLL